MGYNHKHLLITNKGTLRIISYNNISRKNAMNQETYREVAIALNEAATDDSVNVVAITGVGNFFSSGNDLKAAANAGMQGNAEQNKKRASSVLSDMIKAYIYFPKLLIAVVNGPAIGIGATTVVLCDVVYATDNAYFYTPFTALGLCAEAASSYTFPKILGQSKAAEMLLLNYKLTAEEAFKFNMVSEVYKQSELKTKLWPKIEAYSTLPKESLKASKRLVKKFEIDNLLQAAEDEMAELEKRIGSDEFMNAVAEFLNRKSKL